MASSFVVLVGRPNVGKSTLFNRLVGQRMSVVDDQPGTTRDRVQAPVEWRGTEFTLVDTGGLEPLEPLRSKPAMAESSTEFVHEIRQQVEIAIDNADVILFTVDARSGLTAGDEAVADILRKQIGLRQRTGKHVPPVIVVASKGDAKATRDESVEFYQLGLGDVYPVSGVHGDGTGDLLDAIVAALPKEAPALPDESVKIAVVGRPNVGKSSLFNQLIGEQRVIVSDVPGTTRDAIDTQIEYVEKTDDERRTADDEGRMTNGRLQTTDDRRLVTSDEEAANDDESFADFDIEPEDGEQVDDDELTKEPGDTEDSQLATRNLALKTRNSFLITLIDTAGIRKRGAIDVGVEKYSVLRAFKAIERSDVALLVIDAVDGITAQDEHVAGFILDVNKSAVVVVNKWDTVESSDKAERIGKASKGMGLLTPKMQDFVEVAQRRFNFMSYVPIIFVSAKTGFRCDQILPTALRVHEARNMRIPTSDVNRILREAGERHAPPSKAGRRLKIFYASQVGVDPPTFVFHVNDPELVHFTYRRFLENKIRDEFGFLGTPIRLTFKGRREKEG